MSELLRLKRDLDIFSYSTTPTDDMLRSSLHPPVAVAPADRDLRIVWGWPIVRAATTLELPELPVQLLDSSPTKQLAMALSLEARPGGYVMSELDAILGFMEEAGIPNHDPDIAALVTGDGSFVEAARKYRGLCDAGRDLVDAEVVDLKTALRLTEITTSCLWAYRHLVAEQSVSSRRIISTLLDELVRRDQLRLDDCESLIGVALESEDPRAYLQSLRYPKLSNLEHRFAMVRDAGLGGTGISLRHPPYFEGEAYHVEFSFRNAEELRERATTILNLEPACDELFDLL